MAQPSTPVSRPNADFLLVSQLWVHSDLYQRRADLVGFVNGIPLLFIELKASHKNLQHAYYDNLRDYRDTIRQTTAPLTSGLITAIRRLIWSAQRCPVVIDEFSEKLTIKFLGHV